MATPLPRFAAAALAATLTFSLGSPARAGREPAPPPQVAGALEARAADGSGAVLFLPLQRTDVRLRMKGGVIESTVTQAFRNVTGDALEAVYLFPLPPDAAVTDMRFRVGERLVHSEVMARADAQEVYAEAREEGKRTALLEQERPNMFTTSVANILPGETVEVSFTAVGAAAFERGKYTVAFPMVVGPRYTEAGTPDPQRITAPLLGPGVDPGHRLSFNMRVAGVPVAAIASPTHPLLWRESAAAAGQFDVCLREGEVLPNADLVIEIRVDEADRPRATMLAEGGHGLLTVYPPRLEAVAPQRRDVVFVIDTSGSMGGAPLREAKAGLAECLRQLRPGDAFNVVRYSSGFSAWSPRLRGFSDEALADAEAFVVSLTAGGGTRLQPALASAMASAWRPGAVPFIVLLTDGAVGHTAGLVRLLDDQLGRCRVFPVGIGSAPNAFLVRELAAAGRGDARFVHAGRQIQGEMTALFASIDAPVLTDVELRWRGEDGAALDVRHYPDPVPDLFGDRPLQVVAKLPDGCERGSVEISGRLGDRRVRFERAFATEAVPRRGAMAALFGRAQIDQLMRRRVLAPGERAELEDAITALGLEYQLVTEFTARVAVDQAGARAGGAPLVRERVPLPTPRGVVAARPPAAPVPGGDPRLRFPKPVFIGTPVRVRRANLDPDPRPRLTLNAPPEAELLSRDCAVTSSDPAPIIGDLGMVVDGDKDGADGSYVELAPGRQWVQLDLGFSAKLFGIVLWHFHKSARAYDDVVVQISDDPEFRTGVTTVFNNDHDNSSGFGAGRDLAWIETNHGRVLDIAGTPARYLRLYSNGNTSDELNHYVEVEVFGVR